MPLSCSATLHTYHTTEYGATSPLYIAMKRVIKQKLGQSRDFLSPWIGPVLVGGAVALLILPLITRSNNIVGEKGRNY